MGSRKKGTHAISRTSTGKPIKMPIAVAVFFAMFNAWALFVFGHVKSMWGAIAITVLSLRLLWMAFAVILDARSDWPSWRELIYLATFSVPAAFFAAVARSLIRNHCQKNSLEHA